MNNGQPVRKRTGSALRATGAFGGECRFDLGEDRSRRTANRATDFEERFHRGALVLALNLGQVLPGDAGLGRDLLLRQASLFTFVFEEFAEHCGKLALDDTGVCNL